LVLRLKGGDASLFSNILDELQILKEYQIFTKLFRSFADFWCCDLCIPLTAREYSRGVRFLTLYDFKFVTLHQWQDWATTEDTLVFYMSGQKLENITQKLIEFGIEGSNLLGGTTSNYARTKTQVFSFEEIKNSIFTRI
jgi:siroheme synthase